MRIAMVVHKLPPESLGGTELYTMSLARHLTARGHQVAIFCPTDSDVRAIQAEQGIIIWREPRSRSVLPGPAGEFVRTLRDPAVERGFERFLAEIQPELIHVQHLQGVSIRLLRLARGVPRMLTLHDYWYFCPNSQLILPNGALCDGPRGGRSCIVCGLARAGLSLPGTRLGGAIGAVASTAFMWRYRAVRRVMGEVERFVAPSAFLRERYVAEGIAPERIALLPHGLDIERLAPHGPAPGSPGRPHIGYLGAIAWQKGLHILIEAFNRLPEGAHLTVYGDVTVFPEYAAQVRALARHPGIRFAGALPPEGVGDALRALDCLVVPSLWHETFSLVAQEALGVGVPVVASRVGALPERVVDGVTGRLTPPGDVDALAEALADVVLHPERLAAYRVNICPDPTMAEHAADLEALYASLAR
jgi:glycosyltransferase involved in cell wall biosynthesis